MRFNSALQLAFAIGALSEQFVIPQVQSAVDAALREYGNYEAYNGPVHPRPASDSTVNGTEADVLAAGPFWMESIEHQGISAFGPSGYQVFRNVKDFGAKGDGTTDDTAAIQDAIASGNRCGQGCPGSTTTPAVVYFPPGTYMISSPIFDYYYTQIIGDPSAMPVIKGTSGFQGGYLIDADPYFTENLNWGSTIVFFRQTRNLVFDLTAIPKDQTRNPLANGSSDSLQNLVFKMSEEEGAQHQGIFCEEGKQIPGRFRIFGEALAYFKVGSAGMANDLVFSGGKVGAAVGNQQFTMRNLTFNNVQTAISHSWNWGWTYHGITINNCQVGIDISANDNNGKQTTGSITLFDSSILNTPIGIKTARSESSTPPSAGNVIIENLDIQNVPVVVQGPNGVSLEGTSGSDNVAAWGQGHKYDPNGPQVFQAAFTPNSRPSSLLAGNSFYARSKPHYESATPSSFSSVRSAGAKGDGSTDDTAALQKAIDDAASAGKIVYIDAGTYRVTKTVTIPANSKIVGEAFPIIMSSGEFFSSVDDPKPVVQVGKSGDTGQVEWSDTVVSTQGSQAGAILIEWNLASDAGNPSGMWDVHTRVGGFAGSNLQSSQCGKTPDVSIPPGKVDENCIAGYMLVHVTPSASGLLIENCWLWVSDHDLEKDGAGQVTVYVGRGLYVESTEGNIWLWGSSSEHAVLYQYQFVGTKNIFMGQIQTESAYYQPNPNALLPFFPVSDINDPDFSATCGDDSGSENCAAGWGLRVVDSTDLLVYGAGLYSFFSNYDTTCSNYGGTESCQESILSIEGDSSVPVYNLNTIGTSNMITKDGESLASYSDNIGVFPDSITLFRA